jgi:ubiquinone/menaquinone biosynthesis C-methylase UbiE
MNKLNNISHLFNKDLNQYSTIGDIPWAFSNPEESKQSWVDKVHSYFLSEKNELSYLQNKLSTNSITGSKKIRIQQFVSDKNSHLKHMDKLLSEFKTNIESPTIIDKQNILSYQDLIFRDWVWGKEEIKEYNDYIIKGLSGSEKNILVLGAGSCGLSYELAKNSEANIVATDINPYLFLTAKKITSKKHIKLFEFVPHPEDIKNVSIKHEISPVQELPNHHMVFCDFKDMPFKESSFDLIIGCWFFDIVDTKIEDSIAHINRYLNEDGSTIYIGPSNFHKSQTVDQLTSNEILESFTNNYYSCSFELKKISYLNNPSSSYKRIEDILFVKAINPKNVTTIKSTNEIGFEYTADLHAYKQKLSIFSKILNNVDQSMSFDELAIKLESEFDFNSEEAKFYARSFMTKLFLEI